MVAYHSFHRVWKSGKGKEFEKSIFLVWKGMDFSVWVRKNNEIKNIIKVHSVLVPD